MKKFALIGKKLSHSFSKKYFDENFPDCEYTLIELENLDNLKDKIKNLDGFNVTFPYKETIIPYLDKLDENAKSIGAVNVVKKIEGKLVGFNTDWKAFLGTLKNPDLQSRKRKALVLGSGGASKAVCYALKKLEIEYKIVSRNNGDMTYGELNEKTISDYKLIINTTPLGTFPNIHECPDVPYEFLTEKHLLYDLIYNPEETLFLKKGKIKGAKLKNGLEMLERQANLSYNLWNG